jgi:outer membrane biogenesis lipoprotein LolB
MLLTACGGTRAFVRPAGPPSSVSEAAAIWEAATNTCRTVESYAGALGLTGRIGVQRIRGLASATLDVAIDRENRLAMEARVAGQVGFRLGGSESAAVLWLRDGNRVVKAPAASLLGALVGAPFAPSRLREVLAGCPARVAPLVPAARYGRVVQFGSDDAARVFIEPADGRWHVRAWGFDRWTVTYEQDDDAVPRRITVSSDPGVTPAVLLSLRVNHVERDVDVPPAAFTVVIPEGAREMTVDELREAGPLGDGAD